MNTKEYLFKMVEEYLVNEKHSLTEFQTEILDYIPLNSSIEYGENDKEIKIEIWKDDTEEDFYYVFDPNGMLLKSYN